MIFGKYFEPEINAGKGVTTVKKLADYNESLKNTAGNTNVYIMEGEEPGPTFLLLGGTHPRELAGTVAATIFVEKVVVKSGKVIVIPFSNLSAASIKDLSSDTPHEIPVEYDGKQRNLIFGDRRTAVEDQGENDPIVFVHEKSGRIQKDPSEARNLNRNYPGKKNGNLTQKIAFAIMQLIKSEKVDFNLDMHESRTPDYYTDKSGNKKRGSTLAYTLVCHPEALEMGAYIVMILEDLGIPFSLEESRIEYSGLSHWEIGSETDCLAFLSETPNPVQDVWREKADTLYDEKYPLKHRVGIQLQIINTILEVYGDFFDSFIITENLPSYMELMNDGFEKYLF